MSGLNADQLRLPNVAAGGLVARSDENYLGIVDAFTDRKPMGMWIKELGAGVGVHYRGLPLPTTVGTLSVSRGAGVHWLRFTSGAVATNVAGWYDANYDHVRLDEKFIFVTKCGWSTALTNRRVWVGLFSGDPMLSDTPAVHLVGFRFSSTAGDTNWRCCADNGSGTPTDLDSGVAVAIYTAYTLAIEFYAGSGNVNFLINGEVVASTSTKLPTSNQNLGVVAQLLTTTAVALTFDISHTYLLAT